MLSFTRVLSQFSPNWNILQIETLISGEKYNENAGLTKDDYNPFEHGLHQTNMIFENVIQPQ